MAQRFTKGYFKFCPYTEIFYECSNDKQSGVFVYATEEELQASAQTHAMSAEFTQKWFDALSAMSALETELEISYNNYDQN